jgi:hypothetical protein
MQNLLLKSELPRPCIVALNTTVLRVQYKELIYFLELQVLIFLLKVFKRWHYSYIKSVLKSSRLTLWAIQPLLNF